MAYSISVTDVADNLYALGMLRINSSGTGYWMMNESFRGICIDPY